MQCFRTISTTVTLLFLHTWKKSTQRLVATWGEIPLAQDKQTYREEVQYPETKKEAGKHLILKTVLLRQLSTYFNILSHLKEVTGCVREYKEVMVVFV